MELDEYKVEILHYINPHLIWVLVEKDGDENNVHFEQLGLYGILPLDVTIDFEGNVETKRCKEWLPAVFLAMKNILLEASEVWFSVTFLDKTTSIFDDNLHKYGDFIIKMKDGTTISMLNKLIESGFVVEDVQNFHQDLLTKLDYVTTVAVINKIKQSIKLFNHNTKYIETIFNKQISVFLKTIELEETATPRNLDFSERNNHVQLLLRKQMNDLNACKDIDEESAGRACTKTFKFSNNFNTGLMRKLNLIKSQSTGSEIQSVIPKKETSDEKCNNKNVNVEKIEKKSSNKNDKDFEENPDKIINIKGKINSKVVNKDKKVIAFGPAGLNPTQYHLKEVKIIDKEELPEEKQVKKEDTEDLEIKPDMFHRTDSETNVNLNDLDILKLNTKPKNVEDKINNTVKNLTKEIDESLNIVTEKQPPTSVERKMKFLKEKIAKMNDSTSTAETDSNLIQGDDSDSESITALVNKLDLSNSIKKEVKTEPEMAINVVRNNVNPFKNLDGSKSVFVDKLVSPTLMVHTKKSNRIQPVSNMRDIPFGSNIHIVLRNMGIKRPMRPQTVSWPTILRGRSLFLVSPSGSGKTLGYLPAVCRLVSDSKNSSADLSVAPLTCIIVCATANLVSHVEEMCKMFLHTARIFACYAGMTDLIISTTILNGCDVLICTPTLLVHLMRENLGLELRNLNTFVIDDCERISEVYQNELKYCLFKIKEMLKGRANKEVKVQYVLASRIWCNLMSSLAKKAPDSVVCIGAFEECVLYSEVDTTVAFLQKDEKIDAVVNFLKDIDKSKKTVIACRSDDEVHLIEKTLTNLKHVVFACDSTMTIHDLYSIDLALSEYKEPLTGPILVCCDSNLAHINITDASYLIHFSLPELFSMFCKRFAVLIDNYASIFDNRNAGVKIKIFLENNNVEQLPKILNFIKRCSYNVPDALDQISTTIMAEKDLLKAKQFVPLCNNVLELGKCPDIWHCRERHTIFQDFDKPVGWVPKEGVIMFKMLYYHSAVQYSARIISCTTDSGIKKYPQTYSALFIKLGMYYSKEVNRKLHGIAKPGDICAVSLKQNLFARCQVMKVLKYTERNVPSIILINLLDEEKYEMARDTCLYHLPDELKAINSHVVKVVLANMAPQDKDITYSKLAVNQLKKITDENEDLFMRGHISLVIGNCVFVDTLEACQDLSSLNETVVKNNFRNDLLDNHAVNNPNHITDLQKLGEHSTFMQKAQVQTQVMEVAKPKKVLPKVRWAHLECEGYSPVYYLYAKTPDLFFVQHVKFQDCLNLLLKDIKHYISDNLEPIGDAREGDIVIAEFPNDSSYERARIDKVIDSSKVECFFVDLGDWSVVPVSKVFDITEKLVAQLPFQAIECRLVGIKPVGDEWSEFSTNWLVDKFYDSGADLKYLWAKRFVKEKAKFTGGSKYGVGLIDTYADDVYINKLMIDSNLAEENDETSFLNTITLEKDVKASSDDNDSTEDNLIKENVNEVNKCNSEKEIPVQNTPEKEKPVQNTPEKEIPVQNTHEKEMLVQNTPAKEIPVQNTPEKEKRKSVPSFLKSYDKKREVSSTSSSETLSQPNFVKAANDIEKAGEIMTEESPSKDVKIQDTKGDKPEQVLNPTKENQLALIKKNQNTEREEITVNSNSASGESKDNLQKNPRALLNLLKGPIRSVSLVDENSADDDDRWDVVNPMLMLMGGLNQSQTVISECKSEPVAKSDSIKSDSNAVKNETPSQTKSGKVTNVATLISDTESDRWSVSESDQTITLLDEITSKELKLTWSQNETNVTIKVLLITDKYELIIKDKEITFKAKVKDNEYGFKFELYGVINGDKSIHINRDTYVVIELNKVMNKKWLTLIKGDVKKYIIDDIKNTEIAEDEKPKANSLQIVKADPLRKPKLVWRQNKSKVTLKILLITEKYDVTIKDKHIKFSSNANDEEYGFEFELYGVVDVKKSSHTNKGQYIQVNLQKILPNNWLELSRDYFKKWIVYDVDNIDVSSEEDEKTAENHATNLRHTLNVNLESDSDDDFCDDVNFGSKKQY